jgi:hypothetical protein
MLDVVGKHPVAAPVPVGAGAEVLADASGALAEELALEVGAPVVAAGLGADPGEVALASGADVMAGPEVVGEAVVGNDGLGKGAVSEPADETLVCGAGLPLGVWETDGSGVSAAPD